ncbi:helix-turn-helix domain-containing protein [Ferviditalea candida]|uniref:Helix-turn-helix transcriptional regulator n=1 Tax=Ferviditalea candida TaxID=3108399 RepID=A0ABU5ZC44_9BACL|nr:helix-turn-helix transcriptional regulator [Paenibacillaceae bacterium T2]
MFGGVIINHLLTRSKKINVIALDQLLLKLKESFYLSMRETEVLKLMILNGDSNEEIAEKLYISDKTVRNHITNIQTKMSVHSIRELMSILLTLSLEGDSIEVNTHRRV